MSIQDEENSKYWEELCGTAAANSFGFDMSSISGQNKFDSWYKDFYPYLFNYIKELGIENKSVLEVGLGLGTLSRHLALSSSDYVGVDISTNSCKYVAGTLAQRKLSGVTKNCSILELPKEFLSRFDFGIAIGSLHHTGDLKRAIKSLEEAVVPGGKILIMVYNEFDLRRIIKKPLRTLFHSLESLFGFKTTWQELESKMRGLNDADASGESAPYTAFSSKKFFFPASGFATSFHVYRNNFHDYSSYHHSLKRKNLLGLPARLVGTDLYAFGQKHESKD